MRVVEYPWIQQKGGKWWHTADDASPNLTKASLGVFFNKVLSVGAQIGEVWCFNREFPRSIVLVTIFATDEMIKEIEETTKFRFRPPPKIKVN